MVGASMPSLAAISSMRSMPSMPAMPPIDTRQLERAVERGRARMESLAETISHEGSELLEELRHEAATMIERAAERAVPMIERAAERAVPMIERAAERAAGRRRKSRKPKIALVLLSLIGMAGVVAYLFWQRRDEEPAYLMPVPDGPDLTPAWMPLSNTPSGDPSDPAPEPRFDDPHGSTLNGSEPTVQPPAPAPSREFASTPHAGLAQVEARDEQPTEPVQQLEPQVQQPTARRVAPFITSAIDLPPLPKPSWQPR